MLNTEHLMQAIEAAGADHNVVYLSVPITSGRREIALMKELGVTSPADLRANHRTRWLREVVDLNMVDARNQADELRAAGWARAAVVVDPSRMHVEGWDQDDYNAFWVELMARHVARLVAARDWAFSRGARGEVGYALALGLEVVDLSGHRLARNDLVREGEAVREALRGDGWTSDAVDDCLPPLDCLNRPRLQPSAQSEVFYWLGGERKRQVSLFGPEADDARTRADGLGVDGWWARQLAGYLEKAQSADLSSEDGRVVVARYVATACALLESVIRVHGRLPSPAGPDGEHG